MLSAFLATVHNHFMLFVFPTCKKCLLSHVCLSVSPGVCQSVLHLLPVTLCLFGSVSPLA